jgi:Periplasmic binding protein-like domain
MGITDAIVSAAMKISSGVVGCSVGRRTDSGCRFGLGRTSSGQRKSFQVAMTANTDIPEDLSVVGYDDSALMNYTDPPLTAVRQPIEPMGRMATELLVAQITGAPVPHDELLFEPELIVRGSSGAVPVSA